MDVKELQKVAEEFDVTMPETAQIRALYEIALQIALLREDLKKPTWVAGPK